MDPVTAFAPATVSNVACGFDVLGFALASPGDEVTVRLAPGGVRIDDIVGDDGRLPRDATKNTAAIAAQALLTVAGERRGVALSLRKGLPLASGLGGSAASAAAAVIAAATRSASDGRRQSAKRAGPDPDKLQPSAPAWTAARLIAASPGTSDARRGSAIVSSSERAICAKSPL